MTIKKRISYSSAILLVLFAVMVAVNHMGNSSVHDKNDIAYYLAYENMCLQGTFRGLNEFIIDEGEPLSIEHTEKYLNMFKEVRTQLEQYSGTAILNTIRQDIDPQWKAFEQRVLSFMKDNPYISVDDDDAMLQYGKIIASAKGLIGEVEMLAEKTRTDARKAAQQTKYIFNATALAMITVVCLVLFNLYRAITRPMEELNATTSRFGEGNLNIHLDETRKDEFGILASHFNKAASKLSNIISTIQHLSVTLSSRADDLSSSADQIAENSKEQATQTDHAASSIEQMNSSFLDVAKNSSSTAESMKEASQLAMEGGKVVTETIEGMNVISRTVIESAETVGALGRRSEQIGEIIQVINDIAGQTNLLALNAAIEAARAGEQGRGFAVVADEVRKLAERTASSTNEISEMINGIQDDTGKAVTSMKSGTSEVKTGVQLANRAGDALKQIVSAVEGTTVMVDHIATASEEQLSTGHAISSSIESVAALSRETSESVRHSAEAATFLNEMAQEIKRMIIGFTLWTEQKEGKSPGAHASAGTSGKHSAAEMNSGG